MNLGMAGSFLGGVETFFSVWQMCIMQVTPFYLAFFVGVYFLVKGRGFTSSLMTMMLMSVSLALGFSLLFGLLQVPGLQVGALLLQNLRDMKFFAGLFIIAAGTLMAVLSFLRPSGLKSWIVLLLAPLVGAAFAIGYSPCIPPILSDLLNFAQVRGNEGSGLLLLSVYALGICASWTAVGFGVSFLMDAGTRLRASTGSTGGTAKGAKGAKEGASGGGGGAKPRALNWALLSSFVFMIMGVMLITGFMVRYKAFLVNFF